MDSRKPVKNSDILLKYCEECVKSKIGDNNITLSEANKEAIRKNSSNP
ncbi:MAG: hypothetical protein ACFE85_07485 [Candidatus Hodarchaeota archaeon]